MSEEQTAPEEEPKRPPGRPKNLTVRIREFRGQPAVGGIFLQEHKGLTAAQKAAGEKEVEKLKPGQTATMTQKEWDELPLHAREALEVVQ